MVSDEQIKKKEDLVEFLRKVDIISMSQYNAIAPFINRVDDDYYAWFKQWYSRSEHFSKEELNLCSYMRTDKFLNFWESFAHPIATKIFFIWSVLFKFHKDSVK